MSATIFDAMRTTPEQRGFIDAGNNVRLGYRKVGSGGETIIVLHGGPGFTMDYLADDLLPLAARHTLIFYDQRGSGRSTLVSDAAQLDAQCFVDDLEAVRRHFGLETLTLFGHSWGAGIAALYALRFPEQIERLILVDAVPLTRAGFDRRFARILAGGTDEWRERLQQRSAARRDDPGSATACRAYYETWFTPFFADPAAMRRSKGDFCAGTPQSRANKIENVDRYVLASLGDYDWRAGLAAVKAPALVLHGEADPIPVASAVEWGHALPNALLVTFPNAGHFPYVEAPEAFFGATEQFLRGEWPDDARPPDVIP